MSLPDLSVINRFLDDYLEIRQDTWHSTAASLRYAGSQLRHLGSQALSKLKPFSLFALPSANASDEEKVDFQDDETTNTHICTSFKDLFQNAKSLNDWANIIFDLGIQARLAQDRSRESLLCQVLHAVRTFILEALYNDPLLKKELNLELETLNDKRITLDKEILSYKFKGYITSKLEKEYTITLYKSADLGDLKSIFDCHRYGLFNLLTFHQPEVCHRNENTTKVASHPEVNIHIPFYYQEIYYHRYHDKHIKPLKHESFEEFIQRAKHQGHLLRTHDKTLQISDLKQPHYQSFSLLNPKPLESSDSDDDKATLPETIASQINPADSKEPLDQEPLAIESNEPLTAATKEPEKEDPAPSSTLAFFPKTAGEKSKKQLKRERQQEQALLKESTRPL